MDPLPFRHVEKKTARRIRGHVGADDGAERQLPSLQVRLARKCGPHCIAGFILDRDNFSERVGILTFVT